MTNEQDRTRRTRWLAIAFGAIAIGIYVGFIIMQGFK